MLPKIQLGCALLVCSFMISACQDTSLDNAIRSGEVQGDKTPDGGSQVEDLFYKDGINDAVRSHFGFGKDSVDISGEWILKGIQCYNRDSNQIVSPGADAGLTSGTKELLQSFSGLAGTGIAFDKDGKKIVQYIWKTGIEKITCKLKREVNVSAQDFRSQNLVPFRFMGLRAAPSNLGDAGLTPEGTCNALNQPDVKDEKVRNLLNAFSAPLESSVKGDRSEMILYTDARGAIEGSFCNTFNQTKGALTVMTFSK